VPDFTETQEQGSSEMDMEIEASTSQVKVDIVWPRYHCWRKGEQDRKSFLDCFSRLLKRCQCWSSL